MFGLILAALVVAVKVGLYDSEILPTVASVSGYLSIYYIFSSILLLIIGLFFLVMGILAENPVPVLGGFFFAVKAAVIGSLFVLAAHILSVGASAGDNKKMLVAGILLGISCILQQIFKLKLKFKTEKV